MEILTLLLIPICGYLNNMGGRGDLPRLLWRSFFISVAIYTIAIIAGAGYNLSTSLWVASLCGTAFWAVWKWGPGFMALDSTKTDNRDYTPIWYKPNIHITRFCDYLLGVDPLTKLTESEIHLWGFAYMTVRGAFLYPFFIALAVLLTPWALIFGQMAFTQGVIYRYSPTVYVAEWIMGCVGIGLPTALSLIVYLLGV